MRDLICSALKHDGYSCDRDSLPDAPFPICLKHAAEILRYLNSVMPDGGALLTATRQFEETPVQSPVVIYPDDCTAVIYYIRIGDNIKLGYSENLIQRMRFYPPDSELLAIEPGTLALEKKRLRQFRKDLRGRREWFAPSPELLAHIDGLHLGRAA